MKLKNMCFLSVFFALLICDSVFVICDQGVNLKNIYVVKNTENLDVEQFTDEQVEQINRLNDVGRENFTDLKGNLLVGERIWRYDESPYILRSDLEIDKSAKLVIEPGVVVHFAPMVGITVHGILQARGTQERKIQFLPQTNSGYLENTSKDPKELGVRLVDGPSPLQGRLQIFLKGHWRSTCTNSRNWTTLDYETVCRQLGYKGGQFWNWMDRIPGYRPRILYEEPHCDGLGSSIFNCQWNTMQLGSGVCDYHRDIGIQCLPLHDQPIANWRGIKFVYAPVSKSLAEDNTIYASLSKSVLKHVDIIKAGSGKNRLTTAAIEVIGIPPVIDYVNVDHSAFTGVNITKPEGSFSVKHLTVRRSKGIGVFINSSYGLAHLENANIRENGDDGVKYVAHDLKPEDIRSRTTIFDFCTLPITSSQTYPVSILVTQNFYATNSKECGKYFITRPGYVLNVMFDHFSTNKNESARVDVYDGSSSSDRLLTSFLVRNYTRHQTVTSFRGRIYLQFTAEARTDVTGYMRITTGRYKSYDFNVTNSVIEDNGGRGVATDNVRSSVHVHGTTISNNGHIAGIHVTSGAADVNVTSSKISFNAGDGINITYYGGNRNISHTSIASNEGYGFAVWLNETTDIKRKEYIAINQSTTIQYSQIFNNLETGVRHGNFCGDIYINITGTHFNGSYGNDMDIQSCWFPIENGGKGMSLQIGHNRIENSNRIGLLIYPILNVKGRIEHNHFTKGSRGSIYIGNPQWEEFNLLPAHLVIQNNYFSKNTGQFVVSLGLSTYTDRDVQSILFTRNFVRQNKIEEPFGGIDDGTEKSQGSGRLKPRSKVAAVLVISSSNIDIYRNIIANLESKYEIGSQLTDQSQVINATYNWLGNTNEEIIFHRLFHRNHRYNLAKIEYIPFLLHNTNPGTNTVISLPMFVPKFISEGSNQIGGEVDGEEIIPTGTYYVHKDINVRPGGKLKIQPGVVLNFEPSVGIMVAGKLEARGRHQDDILFTLKKKPIMGEGNATTFDETTDTEMLESQTEMVDSPNNPGVSEHPEVHVRLVGSNVGKNEGRLQVYVNKRWGTVCDYGWTITNAALVCHLLGYTLNPFDWRILRADMPSLGTTEDVILSNVQCTVHDTNIHSCKSEKLDLGEFQNSCNHDNDVGVRCFEGAWAGLRFSAISERADLQHVTVEKAGLFDYATNALRPAIQMDFAHHNLDNIRVVDNLHDGLGVIYSDIYGGSSINNVMNSEFTMNGRNGISLKQLGLRVDKSLIRGNQGSGIFHDPVISSLEQKELAGWFKIPKDFNSYDSNYSPLRIPQDTPSDISLGSWETKFIVTEKHYGEQNLTKSIKITCSPGYVVGIQLLNPIARNSTEEIVIFDSQDANMNSYVWILSRDLSTFPVASSGYGIILKYSSGSKATGGTVLMVSTLLAPEQNIAKRIVKATPPTLYVQHTTIQRNARGISANYYNRYYGDINELYLRKANESLKLYNVEISHNQHEAMLIRAPFWDVHVSNLSEVTIHLNNSHIYNNGEGVKHISRDLRSSNNLFHYVLQGTIFEDNRLGGIDVSLPYVWQYNENFTHSVFVGNTTWRQNRNFKFLVRGHFARVNLTTNIFMDNRCENGLIALDGMEKQIRYEYNKITNNNCKFIMEFRADSLSEILGEVPALVSFNDIQGNYYNKSAAIMMTERMRFLRTYSKQPTTTIRLNGNQNVRIYKNLFIDNTLEYELVAGVRSARLNNKLYASENWWGTTDSNKIEKKIFDFDDWNNYAEVKFRPYLIKDDFDSSISIGSEEQSRRNEKIEDVIVEEGGGKVYQDMTLRNRQEPYLFTRDLTVMPNVTLKIDHGVEMQFASDVGILVLGTLRAIGYKESPIVMTSIENKNKAEEFRNRRSIENMNINYYESIRLCTNRNCTSNEIDDKHEGFLEFFNHTTLQWVPICDHRFTERNAQVVCRELGFDPLDVYYSFDNRLEFHTNSLTRIWSWVQPLECRGDETRFEFCPERLNGQLYGRHHECRWDDKFVFVSCTGTPEEKPFWGGIRFAYPGFESSLMEHFHDSNQGNRFWKKESTLEFVEIRNAGILHGEKSPAIQSISKNPKIVSVKIDNTAYHGINLIAPTESVDLKFLNISNTLGQGLNVISLTGEGRESDESSFTPLKSLDLPYSLYSFIDICDPSKVITVEERVILYYKYDNNPVNCVKIFNSNFWVKPVGFRLLQSNLFNHSKEYGRTDSIRLYDGDIYNVTSVFIDSIEAESGNSHKFFKTQGPIMSVRLIASGASSNHGFFAEVVTVPISSIGFNRDAQHNISHSEISSTVKGAISYSTAGEVSPILTMTSNRFENNCRQLYGNFSTCEAAINIDAQNMQYFYFMNNLVQKNQGGIFIRADSRGSATSLQARINSNLFTQNKNRPSIKMEGRQSSPYQQTVIFKNYISQNKAGYCNVIVLKQVVSNFTYNYVHGNVGGRILEISGFEKVRLPIYQTTSHNGFYNNYATDWRGKATIIAGTAGQQYVDNIFHNPENDYEIITVNNTRTLEIWKTKIDARRNYWSYNETISVASRVMDKYDNPQLLEVQIQPFHMNNETILDGKCPPGWTQVFDTCYMYVGSPMSFREAREFCRSDNASMPFIRTDSHYSLWKYLESQMTHMRFPEKVWVQDYNHIDTCTSFIYRNVEVEDCNKRLGFLCEIDPLVQITLPWRADIFAISIITAFILAIILILLIGFCWFAKSKHRHVQRLQRRNSIRQSLRSLNAIDPQGSLRRKNYSNSTYSLTKSSDYKKMESNGSIDSMNKSAITTTESFDTYENQHPIVVDYLNQTKLPPKQPNEHKENNNRNYAVPTVQQKTATVGSTRRGRGYALPFTHNPEKNTYELSFKNEGFKENSIFSGTRNNSTTTELTEDTPIIHSVDPEDAGSDYYGNSSTLPLRSNNDNDTFFNELKHRLPEYQYNQPRYSKQSSFLPPAPDPPADSIHPYDKKIDALHFTPESSVLRSSPEDMRRPMSYLTAVRSSKAPAQPKSPSPIATPRPKAVYQAGGGEKSYNRSKSEALLETNFDVDNETAGLNSLSNDSRSHSQPLETAM
ncbi:hypothetical protein ACFFRR_004453 [Megaselia abdita]